MLGSTYGLDPSQLRHPSAMAAAALRSNMFGMMGQEQGSVETGAGAGSRGWEQEQGQHTEPELEESGLGGMREGGPLKEHLHETPPQTPPHPHLPYQYGGQYGQTNQDPAQFNSINNLSSMSNQLYSSNRL